MFASHHVIAGITGNLDPDKQAQWLDVHGWKYQRGVNGAILVYNLELSRKSQQQKDRLAAEAAERGSPDIGAIFSEKERRGIAYVYLVGAVGFDIPVKVGHTIDVRSRLAGLQTGSPFKLRIIAQYGAEDRAFAKEIERRIHSHYKPRRAHGEWFEVPATEIMDYINSAFAANLCWERT